MSILCDCPMCGGRFNVPDEMAGETVHCPSCREPSRVLPPKGWKKRTSVPPPPPPPPPRPASGLPWYYDFIKDYAWGVMYLGGLVALVTAVATLIAAGQMRVEAGIITAGVGLLAAAICLVSGLFGAAVLLLLVDIGRSLRRMAPPFFDLGGRAGEQGD